MTETADSLLAKAGTVRIVALPKKKIFAKTREEAYATVGEERGMLIRWKACRRCGEHDGEEYEPIKQPPCGLCRDEGGWYEEDIRKKKHGEA